MEGYKVLLVKLVVEKDEVCEALTKGLTLPFIPFPNLTLYLDEECETIEDVGYRLFDQVFEATVDPYELKEGEDKETAVSFMLSQGWELNRDIEDRDGLLINEEEEDSGDDPPVLELGI